MKTMNLITLIMSLFLMASCNSEQILSNEISGDKSTEENQYLYELDIHYVATVVRINELSEEKQELAGKVEKGEKSALDKLENVQDELEKLHRFKEYLLEVRRPIGIKGPIPLPPVGCLAENNCDPRRNIKDVVGVVLNDEFETNSIIIVNNENEVIGQGGKISKDSFGQPVMLLESDYTDLAQLKITITTSDFGTITSTIPVVLK